jgi:acetyl esterase/lipase
VSNPQSVAPVEESPIDYPTFRSKFQTRLVRTGPSPQAWSPVPVPAGVKEITYPGSDGNLTAWVNEEALTEGAKKPAVLWLHGGYAFAREDWDQTEAFRQAGYLVLAPMLRGENGQAGTFSLFANELDDVLAAADRLAKLAGVDPDNLFVAGHEAGGTLALLAALSTDRFRAAAPVSALPDCGRLIAARTQLAVFDPSVHDEILLRSPLAFAAYFRCPVRVYFGSTELLHVGEENILLAERARAAGQDAEAVRIPGGLLECVRPATKRAIEFFEEHRAQAQ